MHKKEKELFMDKIFYLLEERHRYKSTNFDGEKLAELLGMTHRELGNYFQEFSGISLWDFLSEFRIKKIMEVLEKEIIHQRSVHYFRQSGFQSKVSFDRIFKRMAGVSLENYVKRIKEREEGGILEYEKAQEID
jgi:transcriptional regulator GlxA family with amidase domain